MNKPTDRDEVQVILDLYRKGTITINQALNLLGYEGPAKQDNFQGVEWPSIKIEKPEPKGLFRIDKLGNGGC